MGKVPPPTPNNMDITKHLINRLQKPNIYELSEAEKKTIQFEGIETYIYNKVTSRKFRKTSVDKESEEVVKAAIHKNVVNNEPIKFTYPFGGYKIWRVSTYPNADWAEFMTLSYVLRYVAPIHNVYEPGVEIYFSSDDVIIELIDNYPRNDLDSYINSLKNLLSAFSNYFPSNLKLELKQCVPDYYSIEEYEQELDALVNNYELTPERRERMDKFFKFNFQKSGKIDYTNESKYKADLDRLMKYSDAYLQLKRRSDFVRGSDKILLFSNPITKGIDIGSTNVSKAKFWAGIGVFESENKGGTELFYDRVMTPKQWDSSKDEVEHLNSDLIKLPNFDTVPVFSRRFDFIN